MFADASYEGDLMAQAKVSYTLGRESVKQYGESLAGVREVTASHQFAVDIPARDENGKLLPEVSAEPRGEPGAGDKRIQAYNFRVIATTVPENRLPWAKPPAYDVKRYELLARYLTAMTKYMGRPLTMNEVGLIRIIRTEGGSEQPRRVLDRLHRQELRVSRRFVCGPRASVEGA